MSDLVGNPEDRFSRDAAHIEMHWCFNDQNSNGVYKSEYQKEKHLL